MESGKSLVPTEQRRQDLAVPATSEDEILKHFDTNGKPRPRRKVASWWRRWVFGQTFCLGGFQHRLRDPLYDPFSVVYHYDKSPESAAFALVDPEALADPSKVRCSKAGDGTKVKFTNGWTGSVMSYEGLGNDGTPQYLFMIYTPGLLWRWLYRPIAPVNALAKPE
jgi:hypothetical protein